MPFPVIFLAILNIFFEQTFYVKLHIGNLLQCFFVLVDVLTGFKAVSTVPILAFKGNIQHIQREHLILVTQVNASRLMRV